MTKIYSFTLAIILESMVFDHKFNEPWPTKKNFFDPKKKFFWPQFLIIFCLIFFSKSHRNYGDIMPGFWTWSKSIIFMVKTFAVYIWFLPVWSGQKSSGQCKRHVALTKRPNNQIKPVQKSKHQGLKTYCPNIYTVSPWLRNLFINPCELNYVYGVKSLLKRGHQSNYKGLAR